MYSSSHYDPLDTATTFCFFPYKKKPSFFQQHLPSSRSFVPPVIKIESFTEPKKKFSFDTACHTRFMNE